MPVSSRKALIALLSLGYGICLYGLILAADTVVARWGGALGAGPVWATTVKGGALVLFSVISVFCLLLWTSRSGRGGSAPPDRVIIPMSSGRQTHRRWGLYLLAVLVSLVAVIVHELIGGEVLNRPLLIVFVPPIAVSALLGGLGPGLTATFLCALLIDYLMIPPLGSLAIAHHYDLIPWLLLVFSGILISLLSERVRRQRHDALIEHRIQAVMLDGIGDAVIATDMAGCITFLNPAAENLIGRSRRHALGSALDGVFTRQDERGGPPVTDPLHGLIAPPATGETAAPVLLALRDGRQNIIRARARIIRDKTGTAVGQVITCEDITRSHAAEQQVATERGLLRTLINSLPDLVWLKDHDGRYILCNPIFERFIGSNTANVIGSTDFDHFPADMAGSFRANDLRAITARGPSRNEEWITFADNDERILLETIKTPIYDEGGAILGVLGIGRDITSRWQAEQEIRRSADKLRRITSTVPGMLYDFGVGDDGESRLLYASEYCRDIFEVAPETIMADMDALRTMIHPDDFVHMREAQQIAGRDNAVFSFEVRITTPNGRHKWVHFLSRPAYCSDDGEFTVRSGVALDVTDRKSAEQALRDKDDLLREMSEIAHIGAWSFNVASGAGTWTDEVTRIQDLDQNGADDAVTLGLGLFEGHDRLILQQAIDAVIRDARPYDLELRMVTPRGHRKWVRTIGFPVVEGGRVVTVRGTLQDITDVKQAAEARMSAETRFRRMAAAIGEVFILTTPDFSRFEYVSPAFETVWGIPAESLVDTAALWTRALHPEDAAAHRAAVAAFATGKAGVVEFRIIRPDGAIRWISLRGYPVSNDAGRIEMVSGVAADITEGKSAFLRLGAAEAKLRLFIEHAPAALAMLDRDMRYLIVSHRWLTDYRLEKTDVIGRSHYEIFPDIPERWKAAHRRCLAGATEKSDEDPLEHGDGRTEWLHWEIRPWLDEDGHIGGIVIMSENVTDRVTSRAQLRKLSLAVEQSPNGIEITNVNGEIEYINQAFIAMAGYTREELIGHRPSLLSSGLTPRETYQDLWNTLAQGQAWQGEFINRRKTGDIYTDLSRISPVRDDNGAITHYLAIKEDITEKKRITRELDLYRHHLEDVVAIRTAEVQAAEAKLRLILESSADGLYGLDVEGVITFVNPAACTMLGYTPEQLLGRNDHQLFHRREKNGMASPPADCPVTLTLHDGRARRTADETFIRQDGTALPVSYAAHPMIHEEMIVGAVVSFTDNTIRHQADAAREAALIEAQRLARLRRDFIANMSHEIRTPLNAVLGLAQIGRGERRIDRLQSLLSRIQESGQALLDVVDDILDFSKIEAGKVTAEQVPLVLGSVVDRAIALVAPRAFAKPLHLRVIEAAGLPPVILGDFMRLSQVIGNLLSNAVKFTPPDGMIELRLWRDGQTLLIRVTDSGIGMTPEQIGRLFQPFEQADGSTTRNFGGSGLGLSICRHLLTLMNGDIAVESEHGRGSAFTARLPILLPAAAPPAETVASPVALVGFPPDEAEWLADSLRDHGCAVCRADTLEVVPEGEIVVIDPGGGIDPTTALVLRKLAQLGRRVAVVVDPGIPRLAADIADIAVALEWPCRVRHILAADMAAARPAPRAGRALDGVRILAAEDNEVNRLVLDEMLDLAGATLVLVVNGHDALAAVRENGIDHFDVVLTDIQMPEMDGYDLARHLHLIAPDLPVIGVTAHAMPEEEARCLDAGMVAHVSKPIRVEQLVEIILRHVHHPAPAAAAAAQIIDWDALDRHYNGRTTFITRLIDAVLNAHADTPRLLRAAAAARDWTMIAHHAHAIKGSAGNLMAQSLRTAAIAAEQGARAAMGGGEVPPDANALVEALIGAVESVLAEIRARPCRGTAQGDAS